MTLDRLPPQDTDTETACLASALLSREALYKVTEILQPEDFYLEKNRVIFESILDLEKRSIPVDLTTLKQSLSDQNRLDKIGGDPALVQIYQSVSTSANAEHYARRIRELSLRRRLIHVSTQSIEKCYDTTRNTSELIDEVEQQVFSVTEKRIISDYLDIDSVMETTLSNIRSWHETKKIVTGIPTGFRDLDELLTGFHESELLILAARPGMGKTAIALNMMNNIAQQEPEKAVMFFSLEMPAHQLGMRLLCIQAMVDSQRVRTGHIDGAEMKKIHEAAELLKKTRIFIDDTPSISIMEIRAKARRLRQKMPLGLIIIDYLQLITSLSRVDRQQQISEISRFLKMLARELSVPVLALSQLSRAVEQRTSQIPTLSDLRESGAIEQDADVVMFIYREEKVKKDSEKKGIAEIIVAKQRSGPVGDISLKFWEQFTRFDNLDKNQYYEEASQVYE